MIFRGLYLAHMGDPNSYEISPKGMTNMHKWVVLNQRPFNMNERMLCIAQSGFPYEFRVLLYKFPCDSFIDVW